DLSGDDVPEVIAMVAAYARDAVIAYRRAGALLQRVAQATGYPSRIGSGSLAEMPIADLDGDGKPEVIVGRRSREAVVGLGLDGSRFVARWNLELRGQLQSNPIVADVDGDGLLNLAVADRCALHLFLSVR